MSYIMLIRAIKRTPGDKFHKKLAIKSRQSVGRFRHLCGFHKMKTTRPNFLKLIPDIA